MEFKTKRDLPREIVNTALGNELEQTGKPGEIVPA
jgi:hypothetical protein